VRIIGCPYFVLARNIDRVAIIDAWKPIGLRDVQPIPKAGLSSLRKANQSGLFEFTSRINTFVKVPDPDIASQRCLNVTDSITSKDRRKKFALLVKDISIW
jgi:hypothetical protein